MVGRKKRARQETQQEVGRSGGYLKSPFAVRFTNGHRTDFFVRPTWLGDPVGWQHTPGLLNVVMENGARDWLSWSLGLGPSFQTDNPDVEMPVIGGLVSEHEVAQSHGIDLFDEVANHAAWSPDVKRLPLTPAARVREKFGATEKVLDAVHGSLDDQHCLSTFVLTDKALYQFAETGPEGAVRLPLELYKGISTPSFGQMQIYFHWLDELECGVAPRNAVRGRLPDDTPGERVGDGEMIALAGTQLQSRNRWREFGEALHRALCDVLPTARFHFNHEGRDVPVSISKKIGGGGTRLIDDVSPEVAHRISELPRFQEAAREALANLPDVKLPQAGATSGSTRGANQQEPDMHNGSEELDGQRSDLRIRLSNVDGLLRAGAITEAEHAEHRARILGEI